MSKYDKINKLKSKLEKEYGNKNTDTKKINKLKKQIMMLGLGLTGRDLTKPF